MCYIYSYIDSIILYALCKSFFPIEILLAMMGINRKLYVGGGDYSANTGPVYVMSYDIKSGKWEKSEATLPDEQIKRFCVLDGKLVTLGTDPRGAWTAGNYYVLENGKWETKRVLPSAIHCFDAIEYDGKIFFGLGCNKGDFPVAVYDGAEYKSMDFMMDGKLLDTSQKEVIRVYNFFEYRDKLYAFFTFDEKDENGETVYYMDLYAYDGNAFRFVSGTLPSVDMPEVVTTDTAAYFVLNQSLLRTEDLLNFFGVSLGEGAKVSDIIEADGTMYVLAWRETDEGLFEIMVFEKNGDGFDKLFDFSSHNSAGSFCKDENTFYVSLGLSGKTGSSVDAGRVIAVSRRDLTTTTYEPISLDTFRRIYSMASGWIKTVFTGN